MTILNELETQDKKLTRDEHIVNYIKSLVMIDQAIEPYREHKLALKKTYADNAWISRDDQSMLLKALRMIKKDEDIEDLQKHYDFLKANNIRG